MDIETSPKAALQILLSIIAFLVIASVAGTIARFGFDQTSVFGLIALFDLHSERNIPTLFSSIQLVLASLLLFCIGRQHRSLREPFAAWIFLAAIFLFLAIDETAVIHERLGEPMRSWINPSGLFFFPWVIPYGIAVLVLFAGFSRFLIRLPKPINTWFLASGAIYVGGALGSEMLSARHKELHGTENLLYALFYTVEETLEMVGIALFVYALLSYICLKFGRLTFNLRN